jgi:hypothetical protein
MQISVAGPSSVTPLGRPGGFARSARQREWDREQAAWEARLRKLAGGVPAEEKPVLQASLERAVLPPAGRVRRLDALLLPRSLPALVGSERVDLACAGCSGIIGHAISARTARREHPEGKRLLVRCTCGILNLVSASRHARDR